ncbi:MAG: hypothetical protein HOP23_18475 [Methylococcaceae bacterium]|nr:hypothetical protein [Methylococcaceae bacterium]
MTRKNKAAGFGDTQAAQQYYYGFNFSRIAKALKAACYRLAVWLSIIGGALL